MKYIISTIFVSMLFVGFQSSSRRVDFSGSWKLDIKHSDNLPKSFAMVEAFIMKIAQAQDSMILTTTMTGAGQTQTFPPTMYKFDGSETYRQDTARASQRWIKAQWATTGKKLIVSQRVEQHAGLKDVKFAETDVWQVGKKNSLLILITQKYEGSDSTRTERRYYRRVQ